MTEQKKRKPRRNGVFSGELAELKARASAVQREANATVAITSRLHRDIYRKAVEISEQTKRPLAEVIRVAIVDGLMRWTDFSTQGHDDAMVRLRLSTAQQNPLRDPLPDGRMKQWPDASAYDESLAADPEVVESERLQRVAADLAGGFAPLPSVSPPIPLQPDEIDLPPAAPGPEPEIQVVNDDLGLVRKPLSFDWAEKT